METTNSPSNDEASYVYRLVFHATVHFSEMEVSHNSRNSVAIDGPWTLLTRAILPAVRCSDRKLFVLQIFSWAFEGACVSSLNLTSAPPIFCPRPI